MHAFIEVARQIFDFWSCSLPHTDNRIFAKEPQCQGATSAAAVNTGTAMHHPRGQKWWYGQMISWKRVKSGLFTSRNRPAPHIERTYPAIPFTLFADQVSKPKLKREVEENWNSSMSSLKSLYLPDLIELPHTPLPIPGRLKILFSYGSLLRIVFDITSPTWSTALQCNVGSVICAHNHCSGTIEVSAADITLTERHKTSLGVLDIRLLDHIVVRQEQTVSMAARGSICTLCLVNVWWKQSPPQRRGLIMSVTNGARRLHRKIPTRQDSR
jgi:RadC-like JAB domain